MGLQLDIISKLVDRIGPDLVYKAKAQLIEALREEAPKALKDGVLDLVQLIENIRPKVREIAEGIIAHLPGDTPNLDEALESFVDGILVALKEVLSISVHIVEVIGPLGSGK